MIYQKVEKKQNWKIQTCTVLYTVRKKRAKAEHVIVYYDNTIRSNTCNRVEEYEIQRNTSTSIITIILIYSVQYIYILLHEGYDNQEATLQHQITAEGVVLMEQCWSRLNTTGERTLGVGRVRVVGGRRKPSRDTRTFPLKKRRGRKDILKTKREAFKHSTSRDKTKTRIKK